MLVPGFDLNKEGLLTQVNISADEGLKNDSCIHCDELMTLPKSSLTNYVGALPHKKIATTRICLEDRFGSIVSALRIDSHSRLM